jgi:hypothetical protein
MMPSVIFCKHGQLKILGEPCDYETCGEPMKKAFVLGEDDKKLLASMGVLAEPQDDWASHMADAIARGERVYFNPRTGERK